MLKNSATVFTPVDIFNALKITKSGIGCGVDGLAAEHFIYAGPIIHVYLSLLFNCFMIDAYLPEDFMKTVQLLLLLNSDRRLK